jgi:hypothetical protein
MEIKQTRLPTEERLPWHKPEVLRLVINVDTQGDPNQPVKAGSHHDGFAPALFPD